MQEPSSQGGAVSKAGSLVHIMRSHITFASLLMIGDDGRMEPWGLGVGRDVDD